MSTAGTTTLDYSAQVPGAQWLHTTRAVVIQGAANDNNASTTQPTANDNHPLPILSATGTEATSTQE